MNVKIHGLMRSGTNFLEFLLRNNFSIEPLIDYPVWKHGPIKEDLQVPHLIVYKDIYSWLDSIYRYAMITEFFGLTQETTFQQFLRQPFIFEECGNRLEEKNPVVFYNKSMRSWSNAKCIGPKRFISYEKLLCETSKQLDKISDLLGVPRNSNTVVYPARNILPHESKTMEKSSEFNYHNIAYYRNKIYLKNFESIDRQMVAQQMDNGIFRKIKSESL